jgi:hypothetical protein
MLEVYYVFNAETPSLKVQKMMVETGLTELTIETIYFMGLHERFIFG